MITLSQTLTLLSDFNTEKNVSYFRDIDSKISSPIMTSLIVEGSAKLFGTFGYPDILVNFHICW